MMGGPPGVNTSIPGVNPCELVQLSEKTALIAETAMEYCFPRCTTHFSQEAAPYHLGEKTCMERCAMKLYEAFHQSRAFRRNFDGRIRRGEATAPWLKDLLAKQ